ncbi:MAG: hypothetical protein IJH20_00090 [Bacilli bacterium]|nr:hypothetical protein [Bacilli bacterium]
MSKLMDYINDKFIENEPSKNEKLEEKQTKKKLKTAKAQLKEVTEDRDLLRDKYIALLEEKGDGFNQYLAYQNKANKAEADAEEARKCTADIKKDLKDYDNIIKRLFNKEPITSLAKCDDYDNFLAYLLRLYFSDKELPAKGIQDVCRKLEITKSMIKKDSEYLYKVLGVDKWEIE